jgi:hypothetical protein
LLLLFLEATVPAGWGSSKQEMLAISIRRYQKTL